MKARPKAEAGPEGTRHTRPKAYKAVKAALAQAVKARTKGEARSGASHLVLRTSFYSLRRRCLEHTFDAWCLGLRNISDRRKHHLLQITELHFNITELNFQLLVLLGLRPSLVLRTSFYSINQLSKQLAHFLYVEGCLQGHLARRLFKLVLCTRP